MASKKLHRFLAFILCTSLFISAVPNTVTATEPDSKNDTSVINEQAEITQSEEIPEAESVLQNDTETSSETQIETDSKITPESEAEAESETESNTYMESETESTTESAPGTASETDSETILNSETESNTTSTSDIEIEAEPEAESEPESLPEVESETQTEPEPGFETAISAFNTLASEKNLMALLYRTDSYSVRQSPSEDSSRVATIQSGHTLYVMSVEIPDGSTWYQVRFGLNGSEYTGYVESYYLAYSDEDWIQWKEKYDTNVINSYASSNAIDTSDIEAFPAFYQDKLTALKELHPNWTFVPMNTGLDFNTVVENETGDKSLIQNTTSNAEKGWVGKSYGSGWYYATKDAVSYYMNPCNFLTENYIFQFEQLTFNGSYHTVSAIQNFLNGTFMKGSLPDDSGKTYAQAFFEIGKSRSLSPIHLASRVYQEQGSGKSALISGAYKGYEGYYNYFNVKADGKTEQEIITNGLTYAKSQGWNTHYKSLSGGAATIGNGYILKGQDTLYLEKFNVDGSYNALYTHQYMQNIQAPASESLSTKKMYANAGSLNSAFVFKIPVFQNMQDKKHLESITLDKTALVLQTPGAAAGNPTDLDTQDTLTVTFHPADTSDEISVKWSTSDPDVVTLTVSDASSTALVTAVGGGTATVTATATAAEPETGKSTVQTATCQITVIAPAATVEKCTVTFMSDDNTTILETLTFPYEGTVPDDSLPTAPARDGELFIGWFTGKNGKGIQFDSATILSAEQTVVYPYYEKQGKGFYVLPISDHFYTGSAIKPEVQVFNSIPDKDGGYRLIALEEGTDYTVSYKNNKNVNTSENAAPTVIIKGKGNYADTEYAYFNILAKPLTDKDISTENITVAYSGKLQKSTPVIYRSGKKLSAKKDFTVSYPDAAPGAYTDTGTYPITVTGTGGYSGTLTIYQKITSDTLMSKVKVGKIPNQIYKEGLVKSGTGMIPPEITVTYKNLTLREGTDYSVKYVNHLSVGTATAYITAKTGSGFSGTKAVNYKIIGSPINKAEVSGIVPKTYTGFERDVLQTNMMLSLDGAVLREGTDYTVSYTNTAKAGTATIIFKGINGYSGQLKKTYKIAPLDIHDSSITLTYSTQDTADTQIPITALSQIVSPYMKGNTCPDVQLYLNGTPLTKGKDYTIKYANNRQVTTSDLEEKKLPAITVTGKGSLKGSLEGKWKITDSAFGGGSDKVKITLNDVVYKNAADKFRSVPVLTDANGARLSAGKDYDTNVIFTYDKNTTVQTVDGKNEKREAGELVKAEDIPNSDTAIRASVKGLGAYEGDGNAVLSGTYRIINSDIAKAKATVKAKAYQNGDAVTLTKDDIEITLNGDTLKYGTDYTIDAATYTSNLKKGKATVMLKGLGKNYGGEKKITFTITSRILVWWKNLK